MDNSVKFSEAELQQFTGTDNYYRHMLGGTYTDGVKYLAERAKAYWLIDAIFSANPDAESESLLEIWGWFKQQGFYIREKTW